MQPITKQNAFNALSVLRYMLTEYPQERLDGDGIDGGMFLDDCQHLPFFMTRDVSGIWEGHKNLHGVHMALREPINGARWELIGYADTGWALPFTRREGQVYTDFVEFAETVLRFCARWEEHLALTGELNMLPDGSATPKKPTEGPKCGCLTVFDDFRGVKCNKKYYDLADAKQARELLRFLFVKKARSEDTAQSKDDILNALKTAKCTVANDWRPAHVFRGILAPLYPDAIGRNRTKGLYWINP